MNSPPLVPTSALHSAEWLYHTTCTSQIRPRSFPLSAAPRSYRIGKTSPEYAQDETFRTRTQARTAIFDYLEGFYNTHHRHSALGYLSPAEFERQFNETMAGLGRRRYSNRGVGCGQPAPRSRMLPATTLSICPCPASTMKGGIRTSEVSP